jgi:hypothetical protein
MGRCSPSAKRTLGTWSVELYLVPRDKARSVASSTPFGESLETEATIENRHFAIQKIKFDVYAADALVGQLKICSVELPVLIMCERLATSLNVPGSLAHEHGNGYNPSANSLMPTTVEGKMHAEDTCSHHSRARCVCQAIRKLLFVESCRSL